MNTWAAIALLAAGTFIFRAVGPVTLGRFTIPARAEAAIHLVAPALLAALIGVSTFAAGRDLVIDERAAGVAVAVIAAWRRLPLPIVIAAAIAATAGIRALW